MKPVFIRQMIYVAMILAIPLASYFLIFKTRNSATTALETDASQMEAKLGEIDQVIDGAKERLKDHTLKLQEGIDKMSSRRQPEKDTNDIYKALQRMAAGNNLEASYVSKLSRGKADAAEQFNSGFRRKHLASMTLQGKLSSFYAFLLELEKLEDMIYPTEIGVTRLSGEENEGNVEVRMKLDYYYSIK